MGIKGNLHKFRHSFASHSVMNGVRIEEVKELLGHSDLEMTQIYAHLSTAHLSKLSDNLPIPDLPEE